MAETSIVATKILVGFSMLFNSQNACHKAYADLT